MPMSVEYRVSESDWRVVAKPGGLAFSEEAELHRILQKTGQELKMPYLISWLSFVERASTVEKAADVSTCVNVWAIKTLTKLYIFIITDRNNSRY